MSAVVSDTHAIIWYLSSDQALSRTAERALDEATAQGQAIYVPSIWLVELTYLVENNKLPPEARQILIRALDETNGAFTLATLDRRVADALDFVSRNEVPDMPDRIIAATALALGVPLVSRDRKIRASAVTTIW